jgi:hypothetical protein
VIFKYTTKRDLKCQPTSNLEINAILALNMNWAHEQEKDNLSILIKESPPNQWTYSKCQTGIRRQNTLQV